MKCELYNDSEEWRDIPGYEGLYQASSFGRIRSVPHQIKANKDGGTRYTCASIKKSAQGWHGYMWVSLCKDGKSKTHSIHKLVATTFIKNPDNLPAINHIDAEKTNNHIANLEWVSVKENQLHASQMGLLGKPVICIETGTYFLNSRHAERQLGICSRNIRSACSGKVKSAGGYHWKWA